MELASYFYRSFIVGGLSLFRGWEQAKVFLFTVYFNLSQKWIYCRMPAIKYAFWKVGGFVFSGCYVVLVLGFAAKPKIAPSIVQLV